MDVINHLTMQPEYATGIEILDQGHEQFLKLHNQLVDIVNKDLCREKTIEVLYGLMHYTEHHLINEELYYREYACFSEHIGKHKVFVEKINEARKNIADNNNKAACSELLVFLNEWFCEHIIKHDKHAIEYVLNTKRDK